MDGVLAFASLFLGLVSGLQDIVLLVGDQVAAVELRLDGEPIGTLQGEPWRLRHDFGEWPEPHRLTAIATDEGGDELARIEQLVNLPRPPAEAQVVLFEEEGSHWARLVWETIEPEPPSRIRADFDDQPLAADDPERIPLPVYDDEIPHLLHAEIEFPSGLVATAQATFGGSYLDRIDTRLTGVPIALSDEGGRRSADLLERLRPAMRLSGGPAPVVAVEKGPIDLVVVRDQSAHPQLQELLAREARSLRRERRSLTARSLPEQLRDQYVLSSPTRLQVTWPYETESETGSEADTAEEGPARRVFARSGELGSEAGGLLWLLSQLRAPDLPREEQKLADACAIAGRRAATRDRRRAVLLVVGAEPTDSSVYRPEQVARYLRSIRVPLFVWLTDPESPGAEAWAAVAPSWDISIQPRLRRAFRALDEALESQRIVWIEGRHLPREVTIEGAAATEVAGARAPTSSSSSAASLRRRSREGGSGLHGHPSS